MSFISEEELLASLRGDGGNKFRRFMNALIAAAASASGVTVAAIDLQTDAGVSDGGVDLATRTGGVTNPYGYFASPTAWQFKASSDAPSEPEILREINKPLAKAAIEAGAAYIFACCWKAEGETLKAREDYLKEQVRQINPDAPSATLLPFAKVFALALKFPAIILDWRQFPDTVRPLDRQYGKERDLLRTYVQAPEWKEHLDRLRAHFDWSQTTTEPLLTVQGQSGVGKTRLVLEAAMQIPGAQASVLYVGEGEDAKRLVRILERSPDVRVIVVADECDTATRFSLLSDIRGLDGRIRVVTIDNSGDHLRGPDALELQPISPDSVKLVLAENFAHLSHDQRAAIAEVSGGYLRFAADICRYPANLDRVRENTRAYLAVRFRGSTADLKVLNALALFHKIGFKAELIGELDVVRELTALSQAEVEQAIGRLNHVSGFVRLQGRYAYVTPQIISDAAFSTAFGQFLAVRAKERIAAWPLRLREEFWRQCENGGADVKDALATTFREDAQGVTAAALADRAYGLFYCHLAKANPEVFFASLCQALERAAPEEVEALNASGFPGDGSSTRRRIAWLCEQLSAFPEYFDQVEKLLYALAVHEFDAKAADVAVRQWKQLFAVNLSGTPLPLSERLERLQARVDAFEGDRAELLCDAIGNPLSEGGGRAGRSPIVSGRLPPPEWRPRTYGELFDAQKHAIAMLVQVAGRQQAGERFAQQTFLKRLFVMTGGNLLDDLSKAIEQISWTDEEKAKILTILDDRLRVASRSSGEEGVARWIEAVKRVRQLVAPEGLVAEVKAVFSRDAWHTSLRGIRGESSGLAVELGARLAALEEIPTELLEWVATPKASAAGLLGQMVAEADPDHRHYGPFLEAVRPAKPWGVLRGYLAAAAKMDRAWITSRATDIESLIATNAPAAFDLSAVLGDPVGGAERCVRLVREGRCHPSALMQLEYWTGDRRTTDQEVLAIANLLRQAVANGVENTLNPLAELVGRLAQEEDKSRSDHLRTPEGLELAWFVLEQIGQPGMRHNDDYYILGIAKLVAECDPQRVVPIAALILEHWSVLEEGETEKFLADLTRKAPDAVLTLVAAKFLNDEAEVTAFRNLRVVFEHLPSDVVERWLPSLSEVGFLRLAEELPGPFRDATGRVVLPDITRLVLESDSSDAMIKALYLGIYGFGTWMGNPSADIRKEAELLRELLADPSAAVRKWAGQAASWRDKAAERHDQDDAEEKIR